MAVQELKYVETTRIIIGCAMKVHRYFGPGFQEKVYHRALMIELKNAGISCESEVEKPIMYENSLIAKRRLDSIIEKLVLVELKAKKELEKGDYAQVVNYLRVFNVETGLLPNFGGPSLQFKRFINSLQNQ